MYNKYLQNDVDGEDNYDYGLHNRYWEKDFLTTALPSPQMGNAPLIGLAQNNRPFLTQKMTLKPANGQQEEYIVSVATDPDSKQVIGMNYYSENIPTLFAFIYRFTTYSNHHLVGSGFEYCPRLL